MREDEIWGDVRESERGRERERERERENGKGVSYRTKRCT